MVRVATTYGIPSLVLAGRIPRFKSVNTVFLSETVREWYRIAYKSYLDRSDLGGPPNMKQGGNPPRIGLPDRDKNTWKQLKPSTYRMKKAEQKSGKYLEHLSKVDSVAARHVLEGIQQLSYKDGEGTNIRTGRLLAAFFPPRMAGGRLVAGKDQDIKINGLNISIEFSIPYAKRITLGYGLDRPIFTEGNDERWMAEASLVGVKKAKIEYDRLAKRYGPYGEGKNDNRSRSRNRRS